MKNYPYNTGRTVTINLDTLGNAALWQIFQILTDNTGNTFYGYEEEASPAADPDAACEVFLHAAETADARIKGYCDAGQRHFFEDVKREYQEIFETNPADDLRKRLANEEEPRDQYTLPADDEKANRVEQIVTREGLGVTIETICNAGGYTTQVVLTGDANEIQRVLDELEAPEPANEITRTALSGHEYTEKNIDLAETVAERNGIPVRLEADPEARILRATGTAAAIEDFFQYCREAANEEPAHTPAYAAIEEYLGCPEGEFLKGILEEAAEDARRDHTNLFKAGYFEGAARMLAAAIVNNGADNGASVAEITRAAYQYCGLPW